MIGGVARSMSSSRAIKSWSVREGMGLLMSVDTRVDEYSYSTQEGVGPAPPIPVSRSSLFSRCDTTAPSPNPSQPHNTLPHGKVEHKARLILDPALYSERYIERGPRRPTL